MMIHRRRALQAALATYGVACMAFGTRAQPKASVTVRYGEVMRSILYAPVYVAIAKGYFTELGIDVIMTTANGGDKAMPTLLGARGDIGLMGPDIPIYVLNSDSPTKVRIFCGLTATDGFMLVGRSPVEKFDWSTLKGKEILGFRTGSTPLLFLQAALRQHGIDPYKDVRLNNNVAFAARTGSWLAGQNEYAIFIEPDASQLELDGKAHYLASIGETVGAVDYTAFMATDKYIQENPKVIQNWTDAVYEGMRWISVASMDELARTLQPFFPDIGRKVLHVALERYRRINIWKTTPVIDPAAIERFQDILVAGHVLDPAKKVQYHDLVLAEFAEKAR